MVRLHCCVATCHVTRAHNGQADAGVPLTIHDNMRVTGHEARPCKVETMARRLTVEAGIMMPTSDSDGTFLLKAFGL